MRQPKSLLARPPEGVHTPAAALRVAVYTDAIYRRSRNEVYADETFSVFTGRLRPEVARLLLLGRSLDDDAGARTGNRLPSGVEFLALPHYPSLTSPLAVLRALVQSVQLFRRCLNDIDVVWLLGPHPLAVVFAVIARARGRGVVLGVRQDLPTYVRQRRPGSSWAGPAADALERVWRALARRWPVAVVGPDLARRYAGSPVLAELTISLVEDEDLSCPTPLPPGRGAARRLLSVGRLDPEKNPCLLADVLADLQRTDPTWTLVVCGDGPLAGPLRQRLEVLGVAEAAELRGQVPLASLAEAYRSCDAFLHVSWTEGVPQVLLEAFAYGLPVVATAVGGVAEVAGGAALLIPPGNASAAANAVRRLDYPGVREQLVKDGHRIAEANTGRAQRERLLRLLELVSPTNAAG